jgi:hypothetical protein
LKSRKPSDPFLPPRTPRRLSGARKEATERLTLRAHGFETSGWTLNISRGGLRAIVEDRLAADVEYEVVMGETGAPRRAMLVWSQDQSDGQIVGLKYLDVDASVPPADPSTPPREE